MDGQDESNQETIEEIAERNGWWIEKIPEWAMYYLVYGEWDGAMTEDDKQMVDKFLEKYEFIDWVTDENGEMMEPYFSWYPFFGLAANVVDCYITYRNKAKEAA